MKTLALIKVFIFLFLTTGFLQAQDVIFSEDFNDDIGKGNDGGIDNLSGVAWTLNTVNCVIESGDYVKVVDTGSTRLEAFDSDGEAIWMSSLIDISSYTNISISGLIAELGSSGTVISKYIKLYYKLDGGTEILIGELLGNQVSPNPSALTVNTNISDGTSLQVVAKMKLTVATTNKIYIDDISVTGTPVVVSSDALTQVLEPDIQMPSQNISSIINDLNSAQSLLKFKLSEPSGADDLDTKIATIKFANIGTSNKADLTSQFQDFALHDGVDFISINSLIINPDEIIMDFIEGDFSLPDDSSHEYELRGYLKSSGIVDGKKVVMELAGGASGVTTYDSGSSFDAGNSIAVSSTIHQISVIATDLNFTSSPTSDIIKNSSFSVSLNATDKNGNLDSDADHLLNLSLASGGGLLGGNLTQSLVLGELVFDNLTYNVAESFEINASALNLTSAISNSISIISSQSTDLSLPVWIPSNTKISSLSNSEEEAIEVFRFSVNDKGDDVESTFLNALRLVPGDNNSINWEENIGGFVLKSGDVELDVSYTFDNLALDISVSDTELLREIAEGTSSDYSIFVYLKMIQTDEQILQLKIDNTHEGWGTSGSGLVSDFIGDLSGSSFSIDVVGTHLHFKSIPTVDIAFESNFQVGVELTDTNGNKDLLASQIVNISVVDGNGSLSGTLTNPLTSGSLLFNDLSYNFSESIKLSINGDGLISEESDEINILPSKSTTVQSVEWLPDNLTISSLAISSDDYKEVFRFQITDLGDDKVSTVLKTIRLIPSVNNTLDWEDDIEAFRLKINGEIADIKYVKTANDLIINFTESQFFANIPDGSSSEFSLSLYLTDNSTDGKVFQATIDSAHPQWKVDGSHWVDEFTGDLMGNRFVVDVLGTELVFTDKPSKTIVPNESFAIGLKAIDKYGNQDLNSVVEARVSLASGRGELSSASGLNTNLILGKFTWDDLVYNLAENFTVLIEADGMSPILSDNISSLDANSLIIPSNTPIQSKALNPMAISSDNSEVIFSFGINDIGSLDDTPTIINTIKFYNKLSGYGLEWKKHLAGAVLKSNGEIVAKTTKIENEYISFTSLDIEIDNALLSEFQLAVFFKKSMLPDKSQLQVEIRKEHGWKASSTASNLMEELSDDISSAIHYLDVRSDRFSFISIPLGVSSSEPFSIELAAVDAHQNIDVDNNSSVNLSLQSGEGTLNHSGLVGDLSNGLFILNDVTYSGSDLFELAISGDLTTCTESIFVQEDNPIFSDNFETMDLSNWENISDWKASNYLPIKGNSSLKHNLSNAMGSSYISFPLANVNLKSESTFWQFTIKNSDWDPTSSNNFVFHILMDFNDPDLADNIFSVGVNFTGSDDLLGLWKTQNGESERLLKSEFEWNEDEIVAVKVEYTAKGEWKLFYNRLGEMKNWFSAGTVISEAALIDDSWYSGLEFQFETASRAGELWFDNLKIESLNTAPYLKDYVISSDSIILDFSEDLNFIESSKLENFELTRGEDLISINKINESTKDNELVLFMDTELLTGNYSLIIDGMVDTKGSISKNEMIEFTFFAETKMHDLIINEILADETPVVGLPEYEFLEIYNASEYPINVKDYKLKIGNNEKTLSDFEIHSHGYLILCSNVAVEFYNGFGNSLGVSSFPSLTNSGTSIFLESSSGVLLDEVTYSSDWYADEEKKDGGWSLERIDVTNHSWQADNWRESMDISGGTPGRANSVEGVNPDMVSPSLLSFEVNASNAIDLFFSETLDLSQALDPLNYSINEDIGPPNSIMQIEDEIFAVRLIFSSDFEHNKQFQFSLSDKLVDLAGNSIQNKEFEFLLADLPQAGDLVINEVLFNPYPGGADYIELLNISNQVIDVSDISIANRDENFQLGAVYQLTTESQMLDAGSYLLLSTDTLSVKENYSYLDENTFMQISKMPSYNDNEGRVVILNSNNEQLDDFAYNENMHFHGLTSIEGVSLERINPGKETNLSSNWISAAQSVGFGTPGLKNSSYDVDKTEVNFVGFKSKTFSPDNDGVDDRLIINFDLEKSGYVANIRIYNSFGREIRRLASNLTLSTQDELFWDGLLASKERASIGIYILYFELFHSDGEVKTYKKTCVLGGKMK